jgi:N-acyl-D-amino-acid deacylase
MPHRFRSIADPPAIPQPARPWWSWVGIARLGIARLGMACLGMALPVATSHGQLVTAHRGSSHAAPENTLAAFRLAWEEEADAIEADFHLTSDSRIVCIHDRDTERVTGIRHVVADTPLAELRRLDAGRWMHERFTGERLPTFAEVLAVVPDGKRFFIELKTGPEIVPVLAEELDRLPCDRERLLIIAFKAETIAACKQRLPDIQAHWLTGFKQQDDGRWQPSAREIAATVRECGADGVGMRGERRVVDGEFITALRGEGVDEFHVWTIDDPEDARYFRDLGALGITTNRPGLIRRGLTPEDATSAGVDVRPLDVVLAGGTVHRGDGSEPFLADIGVRDGLIAEIDTQRRLSGALTLDCAGLVIAPGFIDLHNHSDQEILARDTRGNANYLLQGCTTIVTGNCGSGHVDVAGYFADLETHGAGTHVAHLLPQGSLRSKVMGRSRRDAGPEELARMKALAEQAMLDGAFGMSTGLIYVPGTFTSTEELIQIARVIARHGGLYASHIRNEGGGLLESIDEAVRIGREAGLPVHVSHLKASGRANWGTLRSAILQIEEARGAGVAVTADQYPYAASSTSLEATLFPAWARDGGAAGLRRRLADPEEAGRIRTEVQRSLAGRTRIQLVSCDFNRAWIGMSLDEAASAAGVDVVDLAMTIQRHGGASVINFGMDERDVQLAMPVPWVATASDGGAKVPSSRRPHPRSFGTFPRKIGRYAQRDEVLPLAAAIRSASGLPAEILGLTDRGRVEVGLVADLVAFEPDTFIDRATYDEPYLPPTGVRHVLVAGKSAVYEGHVTGVLAGKPIRKPSLVTTR